MCPREIMREKEQLWKRAHEEEAIVVFEHDSEVAAGRVGTERGKYTLTHRFAKESASRSA